MAVVMVKMVMVMSKVMMVLVRDPFGVGWCRCEYRGVHHNDNAGVRISIVASIIVNDLASILST